MTAALGRRCGGLGGIANRPAIPAYGGAEADLRQHLANALVVSAVLRRIEREQRRVAERVDVEVCDEGIRPHLRWHWYRKDRQGHDGRRENLRITAAGARAVARA